MRVIWTLDDWAQAVVELPGSGPCPERSVLVPNGRVAHALRRTLIERARPEALIGTRFITPLHLALEIVAEGGAASAPNDAELGPALAYDAFEQVSLERFRKHDLLGLPGWAEAFASTLAELEGALLAPDALCAHADPQVCDVGRVFGRLRQRGDFVSAGRLLTAATARLAEQPRRGPTLVVVNGFESLAQAELLRALPDVRWAIWGVRAQHVRQLARLARLFGADIETAARAARLQPKAVSALGHVQASLFSGSAAGRAQDESVRVATYASVHEEVEAAVSWVVEQIVTAALPAQEIALLSPRAEPYGALLRARLSALPWPAGSEPCYAQAKQPLAETSDGLRLLGVLRALQDGLGRESLAPLLPALRRTDPDVHPGGLSRAWEVLNALAAVGGEPTCLEAGRVWPEALRRCQLRLQDEAGAPEDPGATQRERLQQELAALAPALEALTSLLERVIADEPLSRLWPALDAFWLKHVRLSPLAGVARAVLGGAPRLFTAHPQLEPRGSAALAFLQERLRAARVSSGRHGMPQLYIGTLAGVRGLSFRAVRVLGMCEGAVPGAVREDAVLPDRVRSELSPLLLTAAERAERQLADFDAAVRAAREQLALSAPHVSAEGSVRQPAAVLLDVVQCLGVGAGPSSLSERLDQLAHDGRSAERRTRARLALPESARLERIAYGDRALTADSDNPALSFARITALCDRTRPDVQDGLLPPGLPTSQLAGLHPEHPISATRLRVLLQCPHRHLHENVLRHGPPAAPLPAHELDGLIHGSFVHDIAERFWREHGPRLAARSGELDAQRAALQAFARQRFGELRESYPFASEEAAQAAAARIAEQLVKLLELDWKEDAERTFVDVERTFGFDAPCALDTAAGKLHVRGKIDKLDRDKTGLLVRDLKTGKSEPRRADEPPDVDIDLQLALYARVAKVMARKWKTPSRVHVAYVYLNRGESDRGWRGQDFAKLETASDDWLATAVEVLQQAAFARSPRDEDCRYCPYGALCAPELERRSAVLDDPRVPRRLADLKREDGT